MSNIYIYNNKLVLSPTVESKAKSIAIDISSDEDASPKARRYKKKSKPLPSWTNGKFKDLYVFLVSVIGRPQLKQGLGFTGSPHLQRKIATVMMRTVPMIIHLTEGMIKLRERGSEIVAGPNPSLPPLPWPFTKSNTHVTWFGEYLYLYTC